MTAAAKAYEEAFDKAAKDGFKGDATKLNEILRKLEQAMARPEGLPDREWYQHQVYAPGFYTGYGVKTIPGVREALEQGQSERAREQVEIFRGVLAAVTQQVRGGGEGIARQARTVARIRLASSRSRRGVLARNEAVAWNIELLTPS